jgi:hypothetical protein
MKTRIGASVIVMSCLAVLPAGADETETRPLDWFNAVAVSGGIDLVVRQGQPFRVEVRADDGRLGDVVTEVRSGTLEIRRKQPSGWFNWGDAGSVNVTLPALVALTASGGSGVKTEGTFTSDALKLVASGGSDLGIEVAAGSLDVEASGGSDLTLSGSARTARVQSSGGSDLNASRLMVDEVDVQSSGGSDLALGAVRNKIAGNASGGSDVSYSGQPATVNVDASGGSDVSRR